MDTLREYQYTRTVMIKSRWILLIVRSVSEEKF